MGLPDDRKPRKLGIPPQHSNALKTAALFVLVVVVVIAASMYDRNPTLSSMDVKMLSGTPAGNYHAVVQRLAKEAKRRKGHIENLISAGSVENVSRLLNNGGKGEAEFALVQDGMDWPDDHSLELIGQLGTPESFVILGRDADKIKTLGDLRGKSLGIGPVGSGTERVARQILEQLSDLNLQISTHSLDEQFSMVESGELDLAAMVIDENARILADSVRGRGLQIVDIANTDVLSRRLSYARSGIIHAGTYDPVRQLPPTDKHVIQIDTLVVGNGRASWSETQGLITTLNTQYPDFVRINRERNNRTGLPMAAAAKSYFDNEGPDIVGVHAPWLVDIMPTARWIQLIFGFSILFNAMAFWHRFRLWRIDSQRVRLESHLHPLFGRDTTVAEIQEMGARDEHREPAIRDALDELIGDLSKLLDRCRKQSLSVLVPMGQEMSYRYQEMLILEMLRVLRGYRAKLDA